MRREPALFDAGEAAAQLLTAAAVRERCSEVLAAGLADELRHFRIDLGRLEPTADLVLTVTRESYPDGHVPIHSRWRHFETPHGPLWDMSAESYPWNSPGERLKAEIDLATVSVLLDAGAGEGWRYQDQTTGATFIRSEGLAVASLRMFAAGLFSSDPCDAFRCDGPALHSLTITDLNEGFQVNTGNSLVGIEGRLALLHNLGSALVDRRPSVLTDDLRLGERGEVGAPELLEAVLARFNPIWPGRLTLAGVGIGDVWRHAAVRRADLTDALVPFHKLSQWLTYSLLEPLERAGVAVTRLDGLTGLPEYRNGGLFLDMGVLALRQPAAADRIHEVGSELVVEWRALTVGLLDRLATMIGERTGDPERWPLARILQGGTWSAGRRLARDRRRSSAPPLQISSDGTVF